MLYTLLCVCVCVSAAVRDGYCITCIHISYIRYTQDGVSADAIDEARDGSNPHGQLIQLIVAAKTALPGPMQLLIIMHD